MCPLYIVFVYVDIPEEECDAFEREIYLAGDEVEVIDVSRQAEVAIATTLIGRYDELAFIYLELDEAGAWGLATFCLSLPEEEDVVFAIALLAVNPRNQWRQLLKVGRVAVDEDGTTIVPPWDICFAVAFCEPIFF